MILGKSNPPDNTQSFRTAGRGSMVPSTGFEPVTYRLGGDCSILLSYEGGVMVEQRTTDCNSFAFR